MAKRTRGTKVAQHRPGQRIATARPPTTRPPAPTGVGQPGVVPQNAAADLVVEDALAAEVLGPGPSTLTTTPDVRRSTPGRLKVKPNSLLAARAETEYIYVGQDLRRIAVVAAGLIGVMLVLWVLLVVLGVAGIY